MSLASPGAPSRVLVTGGSGGIGAAVARHIAASGTRVTLVARSAAKLAAVRDSLPGQGHDAIAFDVTDPAAWDEARDRIAPDGVLHGVVTAAAVLGPIGPVGSFEPAAFASTLQVNVLGTLLPIASLLQPLVAATGSVVTFSGGGATGPFPRYDAYAASKAAVVRMSENLAVELAPSGVRVNSVAPGFVMTEMHEGTMAAGPSVAGEAYHERTRRAIEAKEGDPPELAAALVEYLLSDDAAGITGKLVSAKWDPWQDETFRRRLRSEKDFATLRRIDGQLFGPLG
jgi:NAD(P)-dependent dehydrogenase (short-subunit alcohol dehydrogenase family)